MSDGKDTAKIMSSAFIASLVLLAALTVPAFVGRFTTGNNLTHANFTASFIDPQSSSMEYSMDLSLYGNPYLDAVCRNSPWGYNALKMAVHPICTRLTWLLHCIQQMRRFSIDHKLNATDGFAVTEEQYRQITKNFDRHRFGQSKQCTRVLGTLHLLEPSRVSLSYPDAYRGLDCYGWQKIKENIQEICSHISPEIATPLMFHTDRFYNRYCADYSFYAVEFRIEPSNRAKVFFDRQSAMEAVEKVRVAMGTG